MSRKNKVWLVLAGLVLLVGAALADYNVRDHVTHYQNASTGLKTNETGDLSTMDPDRDRDFPTFRNLFNSVTLAPSSIYQMGQAVSIQQYSRASLFLRWSFAVAADSDSVCIAVRVWGRTAEQTGTLHLWTPGATGTLADTCFSNKAVGDTASAASGCFLLPPSFVVVRAASSWSQSVAAIANGARIPAGFVVGGGTLTTRNTLRKIPTWSLRYAGGNGVVLNLSDNAGNPCPFPYIWVEVLNLRVNNPSLQNLACDVWPRVN